jgi:hypothetical protein
MVVSSIYKTSVFTSQKTQFLYSTKNAILKLFTELIRITVGNNTKLKNTICDNMQNCYSYIEDGTYNYHWTLNMNMMVEFRKASDI